MLKTVIAGVLEIGYFDTGPSDGPAVVLLHGFPYDAHAYDDVAPRLAAESRRVLVPFLRGFGPTRFLSPETPRSGQQAALGSDLVAFMDALAIEDAILGGYDWGGRAACIVAALWPKRVRGLVTCGTGYNIQNIASAGEPASPEAEARFWYQYYFHSERGRMGLERNRRDLCRLLWRMWSPNWAFDEATFERSASAFDNPDFVDVVIHSYRHRFDGNAGDPALDEIEARLAEQPAIRVPTVHLQGAADGVDPPEADDTDARAFTGPYRRHIFPNAGHNLPQEAPAEFAEAVMSLG
jgi:pimeloyl-ACP methyl ester carboxylesterase